MDHRGPEELDVVLIVVMDLVPCTTASALMSVSLKPAAILDWFL